MQERPDAHVPTAVAALAVAALYAISVPVGSLTSFPGPDASPARFASFLSDHRSGLIAAVVLNGIAYCALMPAAFAGLYGLLGVDHRRSRWATVAIGAALVESALIGVALVFALLAAYASPSLSPQLAKALCLGFGLAASASAWPTVICVLALLRAARGSGSLGRAVVSVGVVTALVHTITGVAFARSGALSPGGVALGAPPVFALWMACIGVSLLRGGCAADARHEAVAAA